jgi:hypothetical protein
MRARLLICAALCASCACTNNGPSTEEGNPQIIAIVVDDNNRPVAEALVVAYRMPVNNDSNAQPGTADSAASAHTDPNGSCLFEDLAPGRYSVVVVDKDNNRGAMKSDIVIKATVPDEPSFSDTLVLTATGGIHGTVTRNGVLGIVSNQNLKDAFIQVRLGEIYGLYTTVADGAYSFSNLPPGSYTVYYYATDGFYSAKRENITVMPGTSVLVDTVILKPARIVAPKELRAVYDTSAAVVNLSWPPVQYDGLQWYRVERFDPQETAFISIDTLYADTITEFSAGTVLRYTVRSVDKMNVVSATAAGPVEIVVAR